ncbi:TPA: hypothetical protein KD869_004838 [Vibrio parahaemolyticus]|nr:hypothetical protein [Vibrio parahaemolyticus]
MSSKKLLSELFDELDKIVKVDAIYFEELTRCGVNENEAWLRAMARYFLNIDGSYELISIIRDVIYDEYCLKDRKAHSHYFETHGVYILDEIDKDKVQSLKNLNIDYKIVSEIFNSLSDEDLKAELERREKAVSQEQELDFDDGLDIEVQELELKLSGDDDLDEFDELDFDDDLDDDLDDDDYFVKTKRVFDLFEITGNNVKFANYREEYVDDDILELINSLDKTSEKSDLSIDVYDEEFTYDYYDTEVIIHILRYLRDKNPKSHYNTYISLIADSYKYDIRTYFKYLMYLNEYYANDYQEPFKIVHKEVCEKIGLGNADWHRQIIDSLIEMKFLKVNKRRFTEYSITELGYDMMCRIRFFHITCQS